MKGHQSNLNVSPVKFCGVLILARAVSELIEKPECQSDGEIKIIAKVSYEVT